MFKLKITCRLESGNYFYFPGAEDPKDWYKIIRTDSKADQFTFIWLYQDGTSVADPLTSRISSYTNELMKGEMLICPKEEEFRAPELLKSYPCVQD